MKFQRLVYILAIEPLLGGTKKSLTRLILKRGYRKILEVACGTCRQAELLAREGLEVTAIDISDELFPEGKAPDFEFFVADGKSLPFSENSFDAGAISLALHEMDEEDRLPVLKELSRVTKPGGRIFVLDYDCAVIEKRNLAARLIKFIEKLAGKRHHSNFRNFIRNGGVPALAERCKKKIVMKIPVLGGGGAIFELE